jgi:HEPN domain-containing protein
MPPEDELILEWLRKADDDLRTAEMSLSASPPILWIAAFHAQQAAEKALKALLTFHRTEFEKSHNIAYLLQLCAAVEPSVNVLAGRATRLTRYAVQSRYPLPEGEPTQAEAASAVELAREVRRLVRQSLPPDAQNSQGSP